jgi:glycosyltransferase involved in cell wall biosynthesis
VTELMREAPVLFFLLFLIVCLHRISLIFNNDIYGSQQQVWMDHRQQQQQQQSPVTDTTAVNSAERNHPSKLKIADTTTNNNNNNNNGVKITSSPSASTASSTQPPQPPQQQKHNKTKRVKPPQKKNKPSIIIGGITRNSEKNLYTLRRSIERVFHQFDVHKIIFFENDSTDNTTASIKAWNKARWMPGRKKVILISESNLRNATSIPNPLLRTSILAHGRNRLWNEIQRQDRNFPGGVDYVLLIDTDDVNVGLNNVEECLTLPNNWTGCCANTYTIYYDLWALRTVDNWLPGDIMELQPKYHAGIYRHIPADHDPIPVNSCFGGAALYKYRQIRHLNLSTYSGVDNEHNIADGLSRPVCEHVGWYKSIRSHIPEMQLYIQPKMMNQGSLRLAKRQKIMDLYQSQWEATWNRTNVSQYYRLVL